MGLVARITTNTVLQSRSRALVKTAGYRLFMLAITYVVAFGITNDVSQAASIGIVTNVAKTGTYYLYERVWDRISWGVESPTPE